MDTQSRVQSSWHPPFCLTKGCANTHPSSVIWATREGFFTTKYGGAIQRFRCPICGKGCSKSTFRIEFRAKRCVDLMALLIAISSGQGVRTFAREHGLKPDTVNNRLLRLSRQALAIQAESRDHQRPFEDLVADGLVSFTWSQYFPVNVTGLWGSKSQYCHVVDYAVQRRSGRLTPQQRIKRTLIDRNCTFPKRSLETSFTRVYHHAVRIAQNQTRPCTVHTDEHKTYSRVIARNKKIPPELELQSHNFKLPMHQVTSSKSPRTLTNPLMAANYFDREIRKDMANHVRETLQWSKDANYSMARMYMYIVHHNFIKPYRIKNHRERRCHGEVAGIERDFCNGVKGRLSTQRVFWSRLEGKLLPSEKLTWQLAWPNPHKQNPPKLWPSMFQ